MISKLSLQQIPSYTMMGISRGDSTQPLQLSPLGEACSRNDLTAVHEILKKTGYKGDEGTENEVGCRLGFKMVQ